MPIIDLHCDTLSLCKKGSSLRKNAGHLDALRLQKAGASAQFFAAFVSQKEPGETPWQAFQALQQIYQKELAQNADLLAPAFSYADLLRNEKAHKISAFLTLENCAALEGKLSNLQICYEMGVRLATLTWFYENELGFPSGSAHGLKPFGFQALERMNQLGMIVDVSHLSDAGFWDVARNCKGPFVASHSAMRALCPHPRNLSDAMLRALADGGGMVGINFYSGFLNGSSKSRIADVVAHVRHAVRVGGIESVGFGSDFDGMQCKLQWKDYAGYPKILRALSRHFSSSEMEYLAFRNARRIVRQTLSSPESIK